MVTVAGIAASMSKTAARSWRAERTLPDGLNIVYVTAGGQVILSIKRLGTPPENGEVTTWLDAFGAPLSAVGRQLADGWEYRWSSVDDGSVKIPRPTPTPPTEAAP